MTKVSYLKLVGNILNYTWFTIYFNVASITITVLCLALMVLALVVYPWDKGYRKIGNVVQTLNEKLRNL
jgi:hypothetical protein